MPKPPRLQLDKSELEELFLALQVWDKVGDGRLVASVVAKKTAPARNPNYSGGLSQIVRLLAPSGFAVGTTHRVILQDGSIPHWCAHDLRIGDIILWTL